MRGVPREQIQENATQDADAGQPSRRPGPGLFAAFDARYSAAYELASSTERTGKIAGKLAIVVGIIGVVTLLNARSGHSDSQAILGLGILVVVLPALLGIWMRARRKAAFIRTQVDAALFVAPGLTDEEKLKIAGVIGH